MNQAEAGMAYSDMTRSAYLAYAANINHLLPKFEDLSQAEQTAWEAAVRQVCDCVENRSPGNESRWLGWTPP